MAVKLAGAAPAAAVAGEAYVPDDRDELVLRELEKPVSLRLKGGNLFIKRERNPGTPLNPGSRCRRSSTLYLDAGGDISFGRCESFFIDGIEPIPPWFDKPSGHGFPLAIARHLPPCEGGGRPRSCRAVGGRRETFSKRCGGQGNGWLCSIPISLSPIDELSIDTPSRPTLSGAGAPETY